MCYINSSDGLGGANNSANNMPDDDQANVLEVLLHEHGWVIPGNGVVEIFEFEVDNDEANDGDDDSDEDDGDFTAYEWMARTDLEQFDKETEQQYWHEVIAEAEASQRTWDQACASCPDSDLPVLIPDYVEATALNANLIRVAQEESAGGAFTSPISHSSSSAITAGTELRRRQ